MLNNKNHLLDYIRTREQTAGIRLDDLLEPTLIKGSSMDIKRYAYQDLKKLIDAFASGEKESRMVILSGFRGTGKSTIIAQLYQEVMIKATTPYFSRCLWLSMDEPMTLFYSPLKDIIKAYEEHNQCSIIEMEGNTLFLIDEVQYDPEWAATLKILHDSSKRVFIVCTGSSAIQLQNSVDLARRAQHEVLLPMSFAEYYQMKSHITSTNKHVPTLSPSLQKQLQKALFHSATAHQAFQQLLKCYTDVNHYWEHVPRSKQEINDYINWGTLPYLLHISSPHNRYRSLSQLISLVVKQDLQFHHSFTNETLHKIMQLLYNLAAGDITPSEDRLSKFLSMNRQTIHQVINSLEQSGIIFKIPSFGNIINKQPNKLLFCSPAFRYHFLTVSGKQSTDDTRRGYLLEDLIALYLTRIFKSSSIPNLFSDNTENGIDFLLTQNDKRIAIESKMGSVDTRQIEKTNTKHTPNYSIVITAKSELEYIKKLNCVVIPLRYFLLT